MYLLRAIVVTLIIASVTACASLGAGIYSKHVCRRLLAQ